MLVKTKGIVFRTVKYAETSVIVEVFTHELGIKSYLIPGVRTQKAKTHASLLQLLSIIDLVAYNRQDRDINRIKEIQQAYVFQSIPFDVKKSAICLFMAEVARKSIREEDPNPDLFQFLEKCILCLDRSGTFNPNIHLWFLLQLTAYLGFLPGGNFSDQQSSFDIREGVFVAPAGLTTECIHLPLSRVMDYFLHCSLEESDAPHLSSTERRLLLKKLLEYYTYHIDHFPAILSHSILAEVLEG